MWLISAYILLGILSVFAVVFKPGSFWPILIASAVATAGLMVKGYCLLDEYLLGCALLGAIFAIALGRTTIASKPKTALSLYQKVFLIMILYMIAQSFYGLILWRDCRITRWIIYYAMLGAASMILSAKAFPVPSKKNISLIIVISGLVYFGAYFGYGKYCEYARGYSRFSLQGIEWSGSAYAVFPCILAIPAAIMLIKEKWLYKSLGILLLLLIMQMGLYYDSRITFITGLVFIVAAIAAKPLKLHLWILVALALLIACPGSPLKPVAENIRSRMCYFSPLRGDRDRWEHIDASIKAVAFKPDTTSVSFKSFNLKTFIFGYGMHSHHYVLRPYLKKAYNEYLPGIAVRDITRTTGFPALLVDTGWEGVLLLFANFIFCLYQVLKENRWRIKYNYIFLFCLGLTLFWLFVSNIMDITLVYLMIMPSGLIAQLTRPDEEEGLIAKAGR